MFTMIPYRSSMMNRPVNPFADDFFRPFFARPEDNSFRVDVRDEGDSYKLDAELPGVAKEDIHIDIENDVLSICVERNENKDEKNENGYVIHERRFGRMSRAFNVEGIRKDEIQAAYQDGVLRLTLPKEQVQPKETKRSITIS